MGRICDRVMCLLLVLIIVEGIVFMGSNIVDSANKITHAIEQRNEMLYEKLGE